MDLTELKSAWDVLQQDVISQDNVEEKEIMTSVHSKSKSEISKIKKGLQTKFFIASASVVCASALSLLSVLKPAFNPLDYIFSPVESSSFFGVMALAISVVVYFNYQAYSRIDAIETSALNLKENLRHFIAAMKRAIAFNIYSDTFIAPIIFTWAYYAYAFKDHSLDADIRTALLFIVPVVVGLLSYILEKVIQQSRFGKYLERLSEYLNSLQKNSSDM
jgi:hypothetical protein